MRDNGIFDLTGKSALITGASRGLGRGFAIAMAKYGADVACAGRDKAKLEETIEIVGKYGHRVLYIEADVTSEDDIKGMVDQTVEQFGKIDILFNNAGMTTPLIKIHEMPVSDWDKVMNTNLRGAFLVMKYVLQDMVKNKNGSVINISSISGLRAEAPEVGPACYGASKAAIMNLTQVGAMEYATYNIRVNCIAPGMHKSDLGGRQYYTREMQEKVDGIIADYCKNEVPMGRIAEAEELTGLAVLLASDASNYITGQVFCQDGGQSSRM